MENVIACYEALKPIIAQTASRQTVIDANGIITHTTFSPIEDLNVVAKVQQYREYWKPDHVNLLLVAESHVFTYPLQFEIRLRRDLREQFLSPAIAAEYPEEFVNFVYCLGYGETGLLAQRPRRFQNRGTLDYWRIFYACQNSFTDGDGDFFAPMQGGGRAFEARLRRKIELLEWMRDTAGIWLVDASILALCTNGTRPYDAVYKQILECCWRHYLEPLVRTERPRRMIVIGRNVHEILSDRLSQMVPAGCYEYINQPNSYRGGSRGFDENYIKFFNAACAGLK